MLTAELGASPPLVFTNWADYCGVLSMPIGNGGRQVASAGRAETTARAAANYIIWFCQRHGDPITNLKLQKLLYYAQGWFLALHGRPLFREPLRAWIRGPVEHGVWKSYSEFRWRPITTKISKPSLSELARDHIEEVIEAYGDYSALTLEKMTHQEEPWKRARGNLAHGESSTTIISLEDMKACFSKLADEPAQ